VVPGRRALILPCLGRTEIDRQKSGEQLVSVENSMGVVHQSRGNLEPGSTALKSEVAVVCGLARQLFRGTAKERTVDWAALEDDYDRIRGHIEKVVPGFADFNERLRRPGGFYLPHAVRDELRFETSSGKAEFTQVELTPRVLPDKALLLMTVRSHDQFNTTIYGLDDRYRGVRNGRRVIFLNAQDVSALGLQEGQWVDITSHFEGETRTAEGFLVVTYEIPVRCAAAYFPETNVLVPIRSVVGRSNTPTYKSIVVTLSPSAS
jgi:anaerobic selenocysteine-containing dehydrogenase